MKVLVVLYSIMVLVISEPPVRRGVQYLSVPPPITTSSKTSVSSVKYGVPSQRYVATRSTAQNTGVSGQSSIHGSNNGNDGSQKGNNEPITIGDLISNRPLGSPPPIYGVPYNRGTSTQSYVVPTQISFGAQSQSYNGVSSSTTGNTGKNGKLLSSTSNLLNFGRPSTQYGIPHTPSTPISRPSTEYGAQNFNSAIGTNKYISQTKPQVVHIPKTTPTVYSNNAYLPQNSPPGFSTSSYYQSVDSGHTGHNEHGHGEDKLLPANYEFEYTITDTHSGADYGHKEIRQHDTTQGRYYVQLPDGRRQIVDYEADQHGYRPKVTYEGDAHFNANTGYGRGYGSNKKHSGSSHEISSHYSGLPPPPATSGYKITEITSENDNNGYIY